MYETQILSRLESYKIAKQQEKECTKNAAIEAAFPDDASRASFEKSLKRYEEELKVIKGKKSEIKSTEEALKEEISSLLLSRYQEDKDSKEKDELTFKGFGKITYSIEDKCTLNLTAEEKAELIEALVEEGMFDLLLIDEKAYIEHSKNMKETLGHHLTGVQSQTVANTSITLSR